MILHKDASRTDLIDSIKAARTTALENAQTKLFESGQNGQKAGRVLSNGIDEILFQVFSYCCDQANLPDSSFAFVAVGGYGRRQLAPGSDIAEQA